MKNQWVELENNGGWNYYGDDGNKVNGWREIDDKWYFFKEYIMVTGWFKDSDERWYYMFEISDSKTCQVKGSLSTGWLYNENHWYYLADSSQSSAGIWRGEMRKGWLPLNNKWYYLIQTSNASQGEYMGQMVCNCTRNIDGTSYTFSEDGSLNENSSSSDCLLSTAGAKFIGSWEGFYSNAYYDPYYPGVQSWITIGYGTTYAVTPEAFPNGIDSTCTESQAVGWLKEEAQTCAESIKAKLDANNVALSTNEMDCCISFAYNCGNSALFGSTFFKNVLAGVRDSDTITANLQAWSKANGVTSAGLLKRRTSEAQLFLNGDYTGNN